MEIISRKEAKERGLKHYFTGKPCKRGHIEKRFVSGFQCVVCVKMHYDERRKANPEEYTEASRRYRKRNPDKVCAASRRWQKNNPERVRELKRAENKRNQPRYNERNKRWRDQNIERFRERQREYRAKNEKLIAEYMREYRRENSDRIKVMKKSWAEKNREMIRARHARRIANDPDYKAARMIRRTLHRTLRLLKRDKFSPTEKELGYTIEQFKRHMERNMAPDMTWANHGTLWHIDHICPVSEFIAAGVTDPKKVNALKNLLPVYAEENLSKGAKFALSVQPVL